MSCKFIGKGNLGNAPVLKHLTVEGEPSAVVEMYVYFDRLVPVNDDYEDRGGFWLNVEFWADRTERAERVARLLSRGCRIHVEGTLVLQTWDSETGPENRLILKAKDITLDLARVESITFTTKSQSTVKQTVTGNGCKTTETGAQDLSREASNDDD